MYFAYVTIPRHDTDDQWWNWQHAPGSRAVHMRPDNLGTTRAILTFISDVRGLEDLDPADQIAILRRTFADVGGAAPRILAELDDGAPLYFSAVGQVQRAHVEQGPHRAARRRRVLQRDLRRRRHQPGVDRGLRPGRRTVPHRRPPRRARPLRTVHAPRRRRHPARPHERAAAGQSPHPRRHPRTPRRRPARRKPGRPGRHEAARQAIRQRRRGWRSRCPTTSRRARRPGSGITDLVRLSEKCNSGPMSQGQSLFASAAATHVVTNQVPRSRTTTPRRRRCSSRR